MRDDAASVAVPVVVDTIHNFPAVQRSCSLEGKKVVVAMHMHLVVVYRSYWPSKAEVQVV